MINCITASMDLSYEGMNTKEIGKDPLNLVQVEGIRIGSSVQRIKRGTTIVHHRVRKRRPKPLRKGRRPAKSRPPKLRPVYGPPPTQIHIHQPNYPAPPSFSSSIRPDFPKQNNNHFAEPPGSPAFSIPSAPTSSFPFINSNNNMFKKEVTQFQSQQIPPIQQSQQITQISNQQSPQLINLNHQGQPIYQSSSNTNFHPSFTQPISVLTASSNTVNSPSYAKTSANTIVLSPPKNSISQLVSTNSLQSNINNNRIAMSGISEAPTQSIPVDTSFQGDLYQNTVSSYDVPINSFNLRESNSKKINIGTTDSSLSLSPPQSSINIDPAGDVLTTQYGLRNYNYNSNIQPPLLPTRYEPSDFRAIQTKTPENRFNNEKALFDDNSLEKYLNDVSESKRVTFKTRPVKNKSKPKLRQKPKSNIRANSGEITSSSFYDNDDYEFSSENVPFKIPSTKGTTTTTTKRPKHKRRKRPKVSTTTQHSIDVNDAFESGSEIQEYIVASEENSNFEPKKYYKLSKSPIRLTKNNFIPMSKPPTTKPTTTNYIFVSSPKDFYDDSTNQHVRTKTENPIRIKLPPFTHNSKRVRPTSHLPTIYHNPRADDSDEVKMLSAKNPKKQNYYEENEKENKNGNNNGFDVDFSFSNVENLPHDLNSFTSGIYLTNGGFGTRIKHGRAKKDMESEEDYFFEAEYEIELPNNHRFYK